MEVTGYVVQIISCMWAVIIDGQPAAVAHWHGSSDSEIGFFIDGAYTGPQAVIEAIFAEYVRQHLSAAGQHNVRNN